MPESFREGRLSERETWRWMASQNWCRDVALSTAICCRASNLREKNCSHDVKTLQAVLSALVLQPPAAWAAMRPRRFLKLPSIEELCVPRQRFDIATLLPQAFVIGPLLGCTNLVEWLIIIDLFLEYSYAITCTFWTLQFLQKPMQSLVITVKYSMDWV